MDRLLRRAAAVPGIGAASPPRFARDGRTAMTLLPLDRPAWKTPKESGRELMALARSASGGGLQVAVGGPAIQQAQPAASPEVIGLVAAAVILLVAFGSLVAAALPLAVALVSLGISSSLIGILAGIMAVPDWALAVSSLVGIGVALDYSLLIVTRFRAALERGSSPVAATVEAASTAGRSVLVAGCIVVISLLGLFLVNVPYMRGVALSASLAVLVVMTASVTLLPALLAWCGHSVNRLRIGRRAGRGSGYGREATRSVALRRRRSGSGGDAARGRRRTAPAAVAWVAAVQRRPWTAVIAATAVLLALTAPVLGLRLGLPDAGSDRKGSESREAYDLLAQGFGPGANGPLLLVVKLREAPVGKIYSRLVESVRQTSGVASVEPGRPAHGLAVITVVPETAPQEPATLELVERLRTQVLPGSGATVLVGGATPGIADMVDALRARMPIFIGGVLFSPSCCCWRRSVRR